MTAVRKKLPLIPTDAVLTIGAGKTLSTSVNLDVSGADVDIVGSGSAVITFPATTSTLATTAQLPAKISGSTLDTLTDDTGFLTAKAVQDGKNVPHAVPGTTGNVLRSDGTDWTSSASAKLSDTVTTNANLTGVVTSVGNATSVGVLPYKFSVYRNAAFSSTSAWIRVPFDTEIFDTNNNYDNSTNFRYTAPVTGFYQFQWNIAVPITGSTDTVASIYKNGTIYLWGVEGSVGGTNGSALIPATATDYFEIWVISSATLPVNVGGSPIKTYFSGFLVSL